MMTQGDEKAVREIHGEGSPLALRSLCQSLAPSVLVPIHTVDATLALE